MRDALGGRPVGLRARACQLSGCLAHTEVWQLSRRWPGRDRVRAGDGAWHGHGTGRAAGIAGQADITGQPAADRTARAPGGRFVR